MDFGIATFVTDETANPGELAALVEEAGFESLFFAEHSHIPTGRKTPFVEDDGEDPHRHLALAKQRQLHVLHQLVVNQDLTHAQAQVAYREPPKLHGSSVSPQEVEVRSTEDRQQGTGSGPTPVRQDLADTRSRAVRTVGEFSSQMCSDHRQAERQRSPGSCEDGAHELEHALVP